MAIPIPRWLMEKYSTLFRKYKDGDFTFQEAGKTIKEDDKIYISMVLSELKKAGWLKVKINPEDSRKRIYSLVLPESVIKEIEIKN